jgi:hypothetical protein
MEKTSAYLLNYRKKWVPSQKDARLSEGTALLKAARAAASAMCGESVVGIKGINYPRIQ